MHRTASTLGVIGETLKIGAKVKHRMRPEFGVGQVVEIADDGSCTVEFERAKFSGVPLDAFGTVEELEKEHRESEERKERDRAVEEKQRLDRIKANEREAQKIREFEVRKRRKEIEDRARAKERAKREITNQFTRRGVRSFWHITHRDNLQQILRRGILNHYEASRLEPNRVDISDPDAQRWREAREPHFKRTIHSYAPLYVKPRNPMLYVRRNLKAHLCLLEIDLSVLFDSEYLITDGNAASRITKFYNSVEYIDELPWTVLNSGYWPDHDDGKRKMCAEVLVYPKIDPIYITGLHFYSPNTRWTSGGCGRDVLVSPKLFF